MTNSDDALYGWRTNNLGQYLTDQGCINALAAPPNRYPSYYCMELLQHFARGGDIVLTVTNDYELLGSYAVLRTNGTLTMLVVNKSSSSNLTARISFSGWLPATNATMYSYGIPQDSAARTGLGSPDVQTNSLLASGVYFTNTFAPYSASVLVFNPAPPPTLAQPALAPGKLVFQLQGQPGASYYLQSATNLRSGWKTISTNTLAGFSQNVTNTISGSPQFWRAKWVP